MTTAIVILNWNGRDFLKKYLPCLLESIQGLDDIYTVVADNGSTDDSLSLLKEEFPQVKVIELDRNYGFAEGYNLALKQLKADYFLLLNSDVEVDKNWIFPLVQWMEMHEDCGICGPVLHQTGNRQMFEYAGAAGGYIDNYGYPFCRGRVMKYLEEDKGQYDCPEEVFWVSGAALMIRSRLFLSLGGFCPDFFAHMEEIDLCWRARLDGWKVHIVPRSVVYHVGGGSLSQDSPFKLYLNYRNNLLMLHRCLPKTLAVANAYNFLGRYILPDEGPDMFENCESFLANEFDSEMQKTVYESCTQAAIGQAKISIFLRMILDGFSAMVYLLSGKPANFKAVIHAHRDFRKLKKKVNASKLQHYLEKILSGEKSQIARIILTADEAAQNDGGKIFKLKGVWRKWIVLQAILKKESIFAEINEIV